MSKNRPKPAAALYFSGALSATPVGVLSLPQSYIVKPFATILKDLPQPCWHWLTGGTFDSATGCTFESDTDGTFHSDIPGTFESDMGGTFKVLQSCGGCGCG